MAVWINSFYELYSRFLTVFYDRLLEFCDIPFIRFIGFFAVSCLVLFDLYSVVLFFFEISGSGSGGRFQFNQITNDNREQYHGKTYVTQNESPTFNITKNLDKSFHVETGGDD